jgi:ParB-like chromosome segregation protein Spo0J
VDLISPVRHVATEMERAGHTALSIDELVAGYDHPNSGDIGRVRNQEHLQTNRQATEWIIRKALSEIKSSVEEVDGGYRLTKSLDEIRYPKGRKLNRVQPRERFEDSFDPLRGKFSVDIRDPKLLARDDLEELRASMKEHGWVPEFPALRDERGIVLVGHRRLKVAGELGIEPVIKTLRLGAGDEADAQRFRLAIVSNIGWKAFTPSDRQRIAEYLYGEHEWTMARIAKALDVAVDTVSRDLRDSATVSDRRKPGGRGGRPRRKITPAQEQRIVELHDEGKNEDDIAKEVLGAKRSSTVTAVIAEERGRRERVEADKVTAQAIGRHTCTCDVCGRVDTHE